MSIDPTLREAEKRELDAILKSRLFSRSHSLVGLLDYICQKYFEGRVDQIKEYTIAVEHFGRAEEFHSKDDPIVRVDANRLRRRLRRYYRTEGKDHPVYISIPSGQYAPVFHHRSQGDSFPSEIEDAAEPVPAEPGAETMEEASAASGRPAWLRPVVFAGMLLIAVVAVSLWWTYSGSGGGGRQSPARGVSTAAAQPGAVAMVPIGQEIRILAGSSASESVDERGKVWQADRYFSGGTSYQPLPTAQIREPDSVLCRTARVGTFRYDIPLKPGIYEMHLYFAELRYGVEPEPGGESTRRFDLKANGQFLLRDFDIVSDIADIGTLDVKVFKDIQPAADGFLHLSFEPQASEALVSGIEILPGIPGRMRPVRITTRNTPYISSNKLVWEPDFFHRGGRQVSRLHPVAGTPDSPLYQNERYGHFTYRIPVVPGRYTLTLKFAETYFGQKNFRGPAYGLRLFRVHCNGAMLLKDFDIAKEAQGEGKALDKVFHGLESDPQDKLVLTFIPVKNYACVNAIEVMPE